ESRAPFHCRAADRTRPDARQVGAPTTQRPVGSPRPPSSNSVQATLLSFLLAPLFDAAAAGRRTRRRTATTAPSANHQSDVVTSRAPAVRRDPMFHRPPAR